MEGESERERSRPNSEQCRKIYHRIIYMRNISHLWIMWLVSNSDRHLRILFFHMNFYSFFFLVMLSHGLVWRKKLFITIYWHSPHWPLIHDMDFDCEHTHTHSHTIWFIHNTKRSLFVFIFRFVRLRLFFIIIWKRDQTMLIAHCSLLMHTIQSIINNKIK